MKSDPRNFALLFGGGRGDMTQDEIELEIELSSRITDEDLAEVGLRRVGRPGSVRGQDA